MRRQATDGGDPITLHGDVAQEPTGSGSVDYARAAQDKVVSDRLGNAYLNG
jgi:hypothetical protein